MCPLELGDLQCLHAERTPLLVSGRTCDVADEREQRHCISRLSVDKPQEN